jgi:hypothetical protein
VIPILLILFADSDCHNRTWCADFGQRTLGTVPVAEYKTMFRLNDGQTQNRLMNKQPFQNGYAAPDFHKSPQRNCAPESAKSGTFARAKNANNELHFSLILAHRIYCTCRWQSHHAKIKKRRNHHRQYSGPFAIDSGINIFTRATVLSNLFRVWLRNLQGGKL